MPDPLHQRWLDVTVETPMPMVLRRRFIGKNVMISHVTLMKGCDVPMHSHENEQFSCVVSGRLRFTLGAEGTPQRRTVLVGPNEVLHLPSNLPHGAYAEEETVVLDIFSPPSATTGVDRRP